MMEKYDADKTGTLNKGELAELMQSFAGGPSFFHVFV